MGYTLELRVGSVAGVVEELRAPRPGAVDGGTTGYVVAVVHRLTHWYGALGHTSSGGDGFREFLTGPASRVLGRDLVRDLVNRDLGGLTSGEYPYFGWVSNAELRAAVDGGLPDIGDELGPDDEEELHRLVAVVQRAAEMGLDLVGIYA